MDVGIDVFLPRIKCFCANEVDDMQLKKEHFGNKSLVANMGRKRELSSPMKREMDMGLGYVNL